jgi:hypothetical protein
MSTTAETTVADTVAKQSNNATDQSAGAPKSPANYKGFVAGVFSGTAKLAGESILARVDPRKKSELKYIKLDIPSILSRSASKPPTNPSSEDH